MPCVNFDLHSRLLFFLSVFRPPEFLWLTFNPNIFLYLSIARFSPPRFISAFRFPPPVELRLLCSADFSISSRFNLSVSSPMERWEVILMLDATKNWKSFYFLAVSGSGYREDLCWMFGCPKPLMNRFAPILCLVLLTEGGGPASQSSCNAFLACSFPSQTLSAFS